MDTTINPPPPQPPPNIEPSSPSPPQPPPTTTATTMPPEQDIGPTTERLLDLNKPCRITGVNFEGVKKTRPTLLAKMVTDVFTAKSLLDFLEKSILVKESLKNLNAFSSVDIQVKPSDETKGADEQDTFQVTFVVKEKGFIVASAQTAMDEQSTHLDLQLTMANLQGIGDSIALSSKFNKRFYSGECRYSVPLMPWRSLWAPRYTLAYSQHQWDSMPSGYDQEDRSILNQVEFFSLPQLHHTVSFENIWRYIKSSSSKLTPIEVREQCGHSVKSSIKHSVTWDNRLGGNFPYEGTLARFSNEFTTNLVNNSAKFTRHELNLQANILLLAKYDILCQVNLLAGTLLRPHKINICDRFFAGGPLSVRGFKYHGLGQNVKGYPLGDASYLSAGVHIYSILPYTTPETPINNYVRPHIFFNTGTIGDVHDIGRLASRDDIRREALRFRDSLRCSTGFGLVMYFMRLRLEVNYCLPLIFKEGDLKSRGIHWGFGLHYT